jgi:ribose 5-phosphate isomerase A
MNLKQLAAARAIEYVESGMVLGLGTGATERLRDGRLRDIVGIPTSSGSARLATEAGVPLTNLQEHPLVDLTIDGADEIDPHLNLIKGQGGALLHEKIVARASRREIIIADDVKLVQVLGTRSPLAVEVIPFGWPSYTRALRGLGCDPVLRMQGDKPYLSDEGNYIVDCRFKQIDDPAELERQLNLIPGVVENGLFIGLASLAIIASESGVRELQRQ